MRTPCPALVSALPLAAAALVLGAPRPGRAEPAAEAAPVVVEASPLDASGEPLRREPAVLDAAPASGAPQVAPREVESGGNAPLFPPAPTASPARDDDTPYAPTADPDEPARERPEVDKALRSGLALGTGVGTDNVFLGGHVAYYAQFPSERVRIVAHAGGGVLYDDVGDFVSGVRGGAFLAYGTRHRLVLGIYGGTLDARAYGLHGVVIGQRRENGVGFSAGWEWMHETGLYVRATVGPALAMTPDDGLVRRAHHWVWRGNFFAVGYKLW